MFWVYFIIININVIYQFCEEIYKELEYVSNNYERLKFNKYNVIIKIFKRLFNNYWVKMTLFINLINIIVFYVKFSIKLIYHMLTFYRKYFPIKVVTAAEPEVTGQYKLHILTQHWMDFHIQSKNPDCQLSQFCIVLWQCSLFLFYITHRVHVTFLYIPITYTQKLCKK